MAGSVLLGVYQGTQGFIRFAATDTASDAFKPKAISWVLAGGLLSALLGPEIADFASGVVSTVPYAGAYLAMILLNVVGAVGLKFLDIPTPPRAAKATDTGRPLAEIARQPAFVVAVLSAMVGFSAMSLVMTSTPLAMVGHGLSHGHATDVVRWHIIAMFAPSFFTGSVIVRFGRLPVIVAGLCCSVSAARCRRVSSCIGHPLIAPGSGGTSADWRDGLPATTHTAPRRRRCRAPRLPRARLVAVGCSSRRAARRWLGRRSTRWLRRCCWRQASRLASPAVARRA
jgi:hypothetical protein